ncbi:MAG: hypothetical protein QY319_11250 [Candidatus Kapaibacterium sp.]|nr:hypothetical protein [Ignavibacteria bacterium]WKZ77698.1 MAG: hypothetical protein QY319_11250 [Candidatus Kapabacteria bacterium]
MKQSRIRSLRILCIIYSLILCSSENLLSRGIDTIGSVAVLLFPSISSGTTFSSDGKLFVGNCVGPLYIVHDLDNPFQIHGMVKTGLKNSSNHGKPIGILPSGEVVIHGYNDTSSQSLVVSVWTPGKDTPNLLLPAEFTRPMMRPGSNVIFAVRGEEFGFLELNPVRFTSLPDIKGVIDIVGNGKYVVGCENDTITIYNLFERRMERVITTPKGMLDAYGSSIGITDRNLSHPVLLFLDNYKSKVHRFDVTTGERLPDFNIDEFIEEQPKSHWFNSTGDTIIISYVRQFITKENKFISDSITSIYVLEGERYKRIWTLPHVHFDDVVWLGNGRIGCTTDYVTYLLDIKDRSSRVIAVPIPNLMRYDTSGTALLMGTLGKPYYHLSLQDQTLRKRFKRFDAQICADETNISPILSVTDSLSRLSLVDFATDSTVKVVTLPYSPSQLVGGKVKAISPDLRYAAISVNNDGLIFQDLVDTTRSLYTTCDGCGDVYINYVPNTHEMIALGTNRGGVWNMDSLALQQYSELFARGNSSRIKQFVFPGSGDVLLYTMRDDIISILRRSDNSIRVSRQFSRPLETALVIDDNTILCLFKDTLYLLDSTLSTISAISVFPEAHYPLVSVNRAKRLIALRLTDVSDIIFLQYNLATSVPAFDQTIYRVSSPKAYWNTFDVVVPKPDESIRVFNTNGEDVTQAGIMKYTEGEGTRVVSTNLPTGLYTIVDRSSGWISTVMLLR